MLFTYISTFYSMKLYEREFIIVFDEIEFCPAARAAIKYLVEDGRYDYLETGSLLGMQMSTKRKLKKNEKKEDYLVPSEEEKLVMHPMDFEEFLWANGLMMPREAEITLEKMRTIFRIGLDQGHDSLVLSAMGCGAFANPPAHIARLFHQVIDEPEFKGRFRLIDFAILDGYRTGLRHNPEGNLLPFQREFGVL